MYDIYVSIYIYIYTYIYILYIYIYIHIKFLKILSRAVAHCITEYLSFLILSYQTAYAEGRFISEGERLFQDILQVTHFLKLSTLVVTVDIQKAFDSINHLF